MYFSETHSRFCLMWRRERAYKVGIALLGVVTPANIPPVEVFHAILVRVSAGQSSVKDQ